MHGITRRSARPRPGSGRSGRSGIGASAAASRWGGERLARGVALLLVGALSTAACAVDPAPAPSPAVVLTSTSSTSSAPAASPSTSVDRPPSGASSSAEHGSSSPITTEASPGDGSVRTATARPTGAEVSAAAVPVVGVVDGDTIKVDLAGRVERIRVIGIDTPELRGDECYAQRAASRMQSLVQSRSVRLEADPTQDDRDRYGRLLRHVVLPDGRSAARVLIAEGFGREYTYDRPYRGRDSYRAAEAAARESRAGLWGACPVDGSAGRATSPTPRPSATPRCSTPPDASGNSGSGGSGACDIKGNINADGERIYHVPGGRSYARTRITESRGERMFCSESEARAAGWRAARD